MRQNIQYKDYDFEGEETLRAISEAGNFNEWMYDSIKEFCTGNILEIGSGIGNISAFFIREKAKIQLSDIRKQYRSYLVKVFPENEVHNIDIVAKDFAQRHRNLLVQFDTVFSLNVVEHVEDDKAAIANMAKLLKPGGRLVILVPAYQCLFNHFDFALDHFRRYTRSSLIKAFPAELKPVKSWYFNFAGIFGWFLVGNLARKKAIPRSNMRLYNLFTTIFRVVDKLIFHKAGLSVIVVARKINNVVN
jgi:2-polyprenyl-3-methyl-5-hydroxy-6-metoxy-1,4-benzoquinol methylase